VPRIGGATSERFAMPLALPEPDQLSLLRAFLALLTAHGSETRQAAASTVNGMKLLERAVPAGLDRAGTEWGATS
jgi:hypothetical protein